MEDTIYLRDDKLIINMSGSEAEVELPCDLDTLGTTLESLALRAVAKALLEAAKED